MSLTGEERVVIYGGGGRGEGKRWGDGRTLDVSR